MKTLYRNPHLLLFAINDTLDDPMANIWNIIYIYKRIVKVGRLV
jgi:hypothetical protein